MSDKKNEDYVVNMDSARSPRSPFGSEKEPFMVPTRPARAGAPPKALIQTIGRFENSPPVSVLAYCLSSISMTVVNKYVVSGTEWNMNFFYLAVQVSTRTP